MADNWLKQYNFNAISLPRRDLFPTDVMLRGRDGFDDKVGNLPMLFAPGKELPATTSGEPAGSIARSFAKTVELSLGARILGALFGGSNSSQLGADLKAKHANTLSVTYEDVSEDSVAVLELQDWLEQAQVQTSRQATQWLNDEKLAAVTAVLRTAKLSISAERENGASIDLSVPEIEGLVSGEIKVSADSSTTSKITFTGSDPIVFGFQAFIMNFEGNVSFGLEQLKEALDREALAETLAASAWTGDQELPTVGDSLLPSE
jgi:hypothetical protein